MSRLLRILLILMFLVACSPRRTEIPSEATGSDLPQPGESPLADPFVSQSPITVDRRPDELPPLNLEEDKGAITGHVVSQPPSWKNQELYAFACPFYPAQNSTEGFYILEPSIHPNGMLTVDGRFQLTTVQPGRYAVVIGPTPEDAVPISEAGTTKIVQVTAGEILDLGELNLR